MCIIDGNKKLKAANIDTYILDTQLLLGKVLGKDKLYLITNKDEEVSNFKEREFYSLIEKRLKCCKYCIKILLLKNRTAIFFRERGDRDGLSYM